ncbi:MAG: hypothetical protein ACFFER_05380 [Candidatus Thorarchaeota archaeon]
MYGTVGRRGYTVASTVGDDTYGITAISANAETFCIWDRLQIIIAADSSTPFNGVQVNFTLTVTFEYDGTICTSFEVAISRNASYWQTFTDSNKSLFFDVNSDTTYDYSASNVNSETLYGIVAFATNTQRVSWSSKPNEIPTNDASPDLTNADDADNLYARQRFYTIISNVSDADGYWDIDYVELTLYDNSQTQATWTIRYTVSSDLFTVPSGSDYIVLASWSSALLDGQNISITWAIKIDWDHVNLVDVDIEQYVTDGTDSDDDFYEVNWDIETRLAITGAQVDDGSGTADRGSLDGSFTYSGTVTYLGSSLSPRSNETDVWVSSTEYGINIGPWSDLTLTSGTFGVTCYADDTVGEDTYTVKAVPEAQGADGNDLLQSAVQDTYIADRVQVQTYSVTDDRVNVGDSVSVDVTLRYDYDDLAVLDGTVSINGGSATHIGAGIWRITATESVVIINVYNLVSYSGGAHGLDIVDQNLQSQAVIWDQITVREYSVLDDRVNVGESVDVNITIEYEYDDSPVTNGVVTISGVPATYLGSGTWRITQSQGSVGSLNYDTVTCSGNTYGISSVNQNGLSQQVIWDRIQVQSYSVADSRVNIGDNVDIYVTLYYNYDSSPVSDGAVAINGISASHTGSGVWSIADSEAIVSANLYNTVTCSGNEFGITVVDQNLQSQQVIWDRVIVSSYDSDDGRININAMSGDHVTLLYEYDSSPVSDGTVTVNGVAATYSGGSGIWDFGEMKSISQSVTYNSVSVENNIYDITLVNQNGQSLLQIWDSISVSMIDPIDQRINVNENASGIVVTATYDYDGLPFDGIILLNNTDYQYSTVGRRGYEVSSVNGDSFGISEISVNDETYCIWDSLTVTISIGDARIDVGENASINVHAIYDYDGAGFDGSIVLNDTVYQYFTVGLHSYTASSVGGDTHGIDVIGTNDVESVIWDRLRVSTYTVSDSRCNVGTTQTITATVFYEYDFVLFTGSSGTVYLNGSAMTWDSVELHWAQDRTSGTVGRLVFAVDSITDSYFGLSVLSTTSPTAIIWDSLTVTFSITDSRINIGSSAILDVSAVYDYDGTDYDGTLNLNNTQFIYLTAQKQGYTVLSADGDDIWGIAAIGTNDEIYCIWDSLTVTITDPVDQRIDVNTNASGIVVAATYDYDGASYEGTLILNNTNFQYPLAQNQGYTVQSALGDDVYGITEISVNDETYCIWDSLTVSVTDPTDQRIAIGENASGIVVSALYDYDASPFDGTLLLNDTVFDYSTVGKYGYTVMLASGGVHGITEISVNDETYCIFDRLLITIGVDDATPYNSIQANFTLSVVFEYDSAPCTSYQIAVKRNETAWRSYTESNKSLFVDSASDVTYRYFATSVALETQYGITAFTSNTQQVTWSAAPNEVPTNDTSPVLLNGDDGNTLYAKYRYYLLTSNVTDNDGNSDIQFIDIALYDDTRLQLIWTARYTVAGGSFTVEDGTDFVSLASWSSALPRVNGFDIVWVIKIDWDHADLANVDVRQYVTDGEDYDEDFYEVNWNVETRLDYVSIPILSDTRGDISTLDLWTSSTIVYFGSTTAHPLANETDIWALHDVSGTWSDDVDGSGKFNITNIGSSGSVRLNTYTIKVVVEGAGSGGADLYYAASVVDMFVTDRIEFYLSGVDDGRIDIDIPGLVYWSARYDFDDGLISLGLAATLNVTKPLVWNGSYWIYQETSSSVQKIGYSIESASETTYGLTSWIVTADDQAIVWDGLIVSITDPLDQRVNIHDNATGIVVTAIYQYDGQPYSGILQLNYTIFDHNNVGKRGYTVESAFGDLYGIAAIIINDEAYCIWDSLEVTITIGDGRINVGENASIYVSAVYRYDGFSFDGVLQLNDTTYQYLTIGIRGYTVQTASGGIYGISFIEINDEETVIWDRLRVTGYTVTDSRCDVGTEQTVTCTLEYEFDGTPFAGASGTVYLNGTTMAWDPGTLRWIQNRIAVIVTRRTFIVSQVIDNTYGISALDAAAPTSITWDRIVVQTTIANDSRVNINDDVEIRVTLSLEYDNTPLGSGDTVELNGVIMNWDSVNSWFELDRMKSTVGKWQYYVNSSIETAYSITALDLNSKSVEVIWDQIVVRTTTVDDSRVSVGTNAELRVRLWLAYDQTFLGPGDTVILDGVSMSWDPDELRFELLRTMPTIGKWTFYVNSSVESTFGITSLDLNGLSVDVIWDQIRVVSYAASDKRDNIGDYVWINVSLNYDYDNTPVTDGLVSVNGWSFTHLELGTWRLNLSMPSVTSVTFDTVSCSGNTHLISAVNQNSESTQIIWDSITVTLTIDDYRIDVGENASIHVSAVYDYDGMPYDGILTLNDTTYVHNSVGRWTYTVAMAAGDTYGISSISTNDANYVIWDQLRILSYAVSDARCDVGTVQSVYATLEYEYDHAVFTGTQGTVYMNGTPMIWDGSFLRWYQDNVRISVGSYSFRVSAITDDLYNLSVAVDETPQPMIVWDKMQVWIQSDGTVVNWLTQVNFTVIAERQYDGSRVPILSAAIDRNGSAFAFSNFSDVWNGPQDIIWEYSVHQAQDNQFGLTQFDANIISITWVEAPIVVVDASHLEDPDGRTNVGSMVSISFHCKWSTNGTDINTGTLNVNGTDYAINETGWISFSWSHESVSRLTWTVMGAEANGVTQYDQRISSPAMIWDSLIVDLTASDYRINVGDTATIWPSATYEYDGSLFDGILNLNSTVLEYFTVSAHAYTVENASGDSHEITSISMNDEILIIWDRLLILDSTVTDDRCDVGTIQQVSVFVVYEYDYTVFTAASGLVYLNGSPMNWNPLTEWWFQERSSEVEIQQFFLVSTISDSAEGIGIFDPGLPASIIWDSITVDILLGDSRINVGDNASIHISAVYSYDGAPYDGNLLLNDSVYTYSTVGRRGYTVTSGSGDTYGISVIGINDEEYVIWDSLTVSVSVGDERINVGENASIIVSATYDYDGTEFDGFVILNDTNYLYYDVGRHSYAAASAFGDSHGINVIRTSDVESVIWDYIVAVITVADERINIGEIASVSVSAYYDYDKAIYDGVLTLNDTIFQQNYVSRRYYQLESASGDSYNITAIGDRGWANVIWDSLSVTLTVSDSRIDVGDTASITMTAIYSYDGRLYTGVLALNDTSLRYFNVGRHGYTVAAADSDWFNITTISYSNAVYVIWDQLEVYWSQSEKERTGLGTNAAVSFRVRYNYDGSPFSESNGTLFINDTAASYNEGEDFWYVSLAFDDVDRRSFAVTGFEDLSSGLTAIIGVESYIPSIIWDSVYVSGAGASGASPPFEIETDQPAPSVLQAELKWYVTIYFYLRYAFDMVPVSDPTTLVVINGQPAIHVGNGRWEVNVTSSLVADEYFEIDAFRDAFGITEVDHNGLFPAVQWFPMRLLTSVGMIGAVSVAAVGIVIFMRRTRRRMASLEAALGPEGVMSLDEETLPKSEKEFFLSAIEWLKTLPSQIHEMDDDLLIITKSELVGTFDMYRKAFEADETKELGIESASGLRFVLLDRIGAVIDDLDREIESRFGLPR